MKGVLPPEQFLLGTPPLLLQTRPHTPSSSPCHIRKAVPARGHQGSRGDRALPVGPHVAEPPCRVGPALIVEDPRLEVHLVDVLGEPLHVAVPTPGERRRWRERLLLDERLGECLVAELLRREEGEIAAGFPEFFRRWRRRGELDGEAGL